MRFIINVFQILFFWVWTVFGTTIAILLIPVFGKNNVIYYGSKFWTYPLIWMANVKLVTKGMENISRHNYYIYAANHESSFDIPILLNIFPVPIYFLAKAELKKIPFFGWFINAVGMVFIDRKNHKSAMKSLKLAGEEIRKGKNIVTFPEGTRTRDGEMLMFKKGSFLLAIESNIDVIPIAISGSFEVNPPGYKIRSGTITVNIGKRIKASDFVELGPIKFAKFVEDEVRALRE